MILVKNKTNIFINKLREKINVVEHVDIESKKAEDRIKSIVNESRKKYIESTETLIDNLNNLENNKLEEFIDNVNRIFLYFNKSSHMSYERATILIGKEMADIKKNLQIFSKDLIKVFSENKDLVDSFKIISLIKLKLNQIKDSKEILGKINETIIFLVGKINEREKENKEILKKIEEIKESEDYIKNLEKQEKIKLLKEGLEKDILGLNRLIDFKALANFFHIFKEQMGIVKAHRENFQTSFRKDDGESIIKLLNDSKLNSETISERIKQINNKKEEIVKVKQEIKKDGTEELYSETTRIILEIENLKNEKRREEKRKEKLRIRKKEINEEIKEELKKIGGYVDFS